MDSFTHLIQQGAGNAWFFIPSAILLGALHGLEPGHSKTMMAAFIIAIRGTVLQVILLAIAATVSHTAIVWVVALAGLRYGEHWSAATSEPYFQIASAILIIGVALWVLVRTRREQQLEKLEGHQRDQIHVHHTHGDETKKVVTEHGIVTIEIFETGMASHFRLRFEERGHSVSPPKTDNVAIVIERPNGQRNTFTFINKGDYLESIAAITEPHKFIARLSLKHHNHSHNYDVEFIEHSHDHVHPEYAALDVSSPGYQDAHELAHANDIKRRFANGNVTTGQIILFGLTGGLIPCPAAITVLLLCLQLKHFWLGVMLVFCFSVGLALTLIASGSIAAFSIRHVSKRWSGFGKWVRRVPYFSSLIIIGIGLYIGYQGFAGLKLF